MDKFENAVREVFDYNRFDMHPAMKELIAAVELQHHAAAKKVDTRERTSFGELQGNPTARAVTKATDAQLSTERDKGKS